MKFKITFKSPDGVSDSINYASEQEYLKDKDENFIEKFEMLSYKEKKQELSEVKENIEDFIRKWISSGEYITIEFDTDTGTAKVVEK